MAKVITIDGPTSSGKSSVGFLFAKKIGFVFIDSGAIYRAGCLRIIEKGIETGSKEEISQIFKNIDLEFKKGESDVRVFLDKKDVTGELHSPKVTEIVPFVAAIPKVRGYVKKLQIKIAKREDTVMTGRDTGSVVFPNAKLKFFLTAEPKVRAERRFKQLVKKDPKITFDEVYKQMIERDEKDSKRKYSPMVVPKGAVLVDTTNLTTDQTVELMQIHTPGV